MLSLKQSKHLATAVACIWVTALAAGQAAAQQPNSVTISGTIGFPVYGEHTWTLTLQGLSYSYGAAPSNYYAGLLTSVYATSIDFEFQGPHAAELNVNVSEPLVNSGIPHRPFVELINYKIWDSDWGYFADVKDWLIQVAPVDDQEGLRFYSWPSLNYE